MGIILKQGFWSTVVIYFGVILGFINSIILFPTFLTTEQIGLFRQIISASTLLVPLTTFGVSAAYVKFYPIFKNNSEQKNQFFSYNLLVIIVSYLFTTLCIFIFFNEISLIFKENSQLFLDYFYVVYFILFILSLSVLFESYLRSRYDTILSNIINGVSNRLFTSISIFLFSISLLNFKNIIDLQIIIYGLGLITIILYAYKKDSFKLFIRFDKIKFKLKEIFNYSTYSFIGLSSNIIVLNIDVLMVTSLLGLSETGIYTTAFYIGMIIEIPRRAISQISIPYISENIKEENFKKIEKNYKDISIHQMIIGVLFYIILILNIDNIFNLIPNSEKFYLGKDIVYIIGLSKLIIMSFSYNSELISLSKYYKFTVITIICLAILTIGLNLFLIPRFGMIGAAYASLISITFYNLLKHIFIKYKMKISPFSINSIKTILVGIFVYFAVLSLPKNDIILIDIFIKTIISSFIFVISVYALKISPDLNKLIKSRLN